MVSNTNEMHSTLSKKSLKKWNKIKARLEKNGAEVLTSSTSCHLAIGNAGLHNGVCPKQLMDIIEDFGQVDMFQSYPGKAYVIVSYTFIDSCVQAYQKLQNYDILKCDGSKMYATLYTYYLKNPIVPNDVRNSSLSTTKLLPSGLNIIEDFISSDEENCLVELVNRDFSQQSLNHSKNNLKHREVLHYGYSFKYGSNDVDLDDPLANRDLPVLIKELIDKILNSGLCSERPDQVTVNKYEPGQGISDHIDNPKAFGKEIMSISMLSQTVFEMRQNNGCHVNILLKPCSLLVMSGESRYSWSHGIRAKKFDVLKKENESAPTITPRSTRISITFRKVLKEEKCESDLPSPVLTNEDASSLENQHVRQVYNKIADHFACTREKPWPNVVKFLMTLQPYSKVLDVGCGSGRYLNVRNDIFMLGCDFSSSLIEVCSKKHKFLVVGDGLNIPVRSASFDACICIAVIHHYSTRERRETAIKELLRVLVPGGSLLIYVWAEEQSYKNKNSSYLKSKDSASSDSDAHERLKNTDASCQSIDKDTQSKMIFPVHTNRKHFATQDVFVPWTNKTTWKSPDASSGDDTYLRYYHVFKENELVQICESLPNCEITQSYHDNGNWALILQKCS